MSAKRNRIMAGILITALILNIMPRTMLRANAAESGGNAPYPAASDGMHTQEDSSALLCREIAVQPGQLIGDTCYTVHVHTYENGVCTGCGAVNPEAINGTALDAFEYTLDEASKTITLTKYIGTDADVTVPNYYYVGNVLYKTLLRSETVFCGNTTITDVTICSGVGFAEDIMYKLFESCPKLTTVDMTGVDTSKVTSMRELFSLSTKLTTVYGYESWDTGCVESIFKMFNRVQNMEIVDLSRWDLHSLKNSGWCFQLCYAKQILLPDNLAVISAGFLNHAAKVTGTTYTIPAGVKEIGCAHTIYDFATDDFVEFVVAEGNTNYKAVDGILYSADGTKMLAVPRGKTFTDGVYEIPEGVTFLGELSFSRNYNITTLVLPDSYEIKYVPLYDREYIVFEDIGNLNAGTNLSIALYCYTGVTQYQVKNTNPRYVSVDGILYSKDMTEVVAIPARYRQEMVIPEGVTNWNMEAMWADFDNNSQNTLAGLLVNCPGVSIPASLTEISADQMDMLNLLYNNRVGTSNPFTITIAEGNTAFELDENGNLCRVCVHSYENGICTGCGEADPQSGELAGKTISILGDSISTYTGVSNNTACNSTIGSNAVYYSGRNLGISQADTWWQQAIDALGMELLVNNSWSGSCILHTRSNTVGAYVDRCVQLHDDTGDNAGEKPDIIAVFLGTNDFSYYQSALGTADIDYDALITDNGDGTYTYAAPTTSCEAYAVMLHKMTERYPDAEIYCMTLTARRDPDKEDNYADVGQPTAFNAELTEIIEHFGCTVVDLENCGMEKEAEVFDIYMGDGRVHPNAEGMDLITQALVSAMLGKETKVYDVFAGLTGVTSDNDASVALSGETYTATLTGKGDTADMDVSITMDGVDVTETVYADGKITIESVTGDITITAVDNTPANYRWEFDGETLVSITGDDYSENTLTLQGGSVSDGILSNAYYLMGEKVVLRYGRPWMVEFKVSGNWSGMLFSAQKSAGTAGNTYLFKTNGTNGFMGFGERVNSQYQNYGIALVSQGVDTTLEHTYRLENRIAADGSNMVYLLVDGKDYGEMNNYFIGGSNDQSTTEDWLNGRDLIFSYIGANSHAMNNCSIEYIQVWESHIHSYAPTVTAPACTEQGYTTHTCTICGESDTDTYTDALGHSFGGYRSNGDGTMTARCVRCDAADTIPDPAVKYRIDSITVRDENGAVLSAIPGGKCLATVSVTNLSSADDALVLLAAYTAEGRYQGLLWAGVEALPVGAAAEVTLPVDNSSGKIASLKAFVVASFSDPTPLGNSGSWQGSLHSQINGSKKAEKV